MRGLHRGVVVTSVLSKVEEDLAILRGVDVALSPSGILLDNSDAYTRARSGNLCVVALVNSTGVSTGITCLVLGNTTEYHFAYACVV